MCNYWVFYVVIAPKSKGQWRGRSRRGQNYGRFPSQEHYRQQRDSSDRKGAYNQPHRRGTVADRRPPARSPFQTSVDSRKVWYVLVLQLDQNIVPGPSCSKPDYANPGLMRTLIRV